MMTVDLLALLDILRFVVTAVGSGELGEGWRMTVKQDRLIVGE